jgi:hypothetical protein
LIPRDLGLKCPESLLAAVGIGSLPEIREGNVIINCSINESEEHTQGIELTSLQITTDVTVSFEGSIIQRFNSEIKQQ